MNKFWEFKNQTADSADLNIYNEISDNDWWGEGLVTPKQFQSDLKAIGSVSQLNIHINSPGGGVFAGHTISNMLRAHPANKTVYVDGLAASIASVIAMVGNKVIMQPGSMMMVHNPANFMFGAYQASDMREMADVLDKIKESLVSVYQAKTQKTCEEISAIMDDETWLTAEDAVAMGFADELGTGVIVNSCINGKILNVAGKSFDLSRFKNMPRDIRQAATGGIVNQISIPIPDSTGLIVPISNKSKEEKIVDIKELQAKYPDLYTEVLNIGVTQERSRMKALDEIQLPGHEDIIDKARYETGDSAEKVALAIVAAEKSRQTNHLANTTSDAQDSNVNSVASAAAPDVGGEAKETEIKNAAAKISAAANRKRGE